VHLSGQLGRYIEPSPRGGQPIHHGPKADQDLIDARHAPQRLPDDRSTTVEA